MCGWQSVVVRRLEPGPLPEPSQEGESAEAAPPFLSSRPAHSGGLRPAPPPPACSLPFVDAARREEADRHTTSTYLSSDRMDNKPVALATLSSLPATGEAPLPVSPQPSDPIRTPSTAARSDDDNDHKLDKTIGRADSGDGKSAVVGAGEAVAGGHWRLKNLDDGFDSKAADAPTEPLRRRWWDYLLRRYRPPPPAAPPSLDDAEITPLASASFLSLLTFSWITPLMDLGYRRTLQATECVSPATQIPVRMHC